MRMMSFSLTTSQFIAGIKTVTRRLGWKTLKAGDVLMAVEKARGLRKGEHVKRLGQIEIVSVRRERLAAMKADYGRCEARLEGFLGTMEPEDFIKFYCAMNNCTPDVTVTRIEFRKLE